MVHLVHSVFLIIVNLSGMVFPLLYPLFPAPDVRFYLVFLSWPIFGFCIWACSVGDLNFTDESNETVHLNRKLRPFQFFTAMWVATIAGWLFMLVVRAGERL